MIVHDKYSCYKLSRYRGADINRVRLATYTHPQRCYNCGWLNPQLTVYRGFCYGMLRIVCVSCVDKFEAEQIMKVLNK